MCYKEPCTMTTKIENLKVKTLTLKNNNDTLIIPNSNILKAINFACKYLNVDSDTSANGSW